MNIYEMIDIWNAGGTTFTAIKMDVTDTASAAGSLLMDLQVGGTSKAAIHKSGYHVAVGYASDSVYGTIRFGDGTFGTTVDYMGIRDGGVVAVRSGGNYSWVSDNNASAGTIDLSLFRDAADTLAIRRLTNPQTVNFYNTWTSATDYHRVAIKTANATLSNVSGATVTATSIIPDGAVVVGVTTKVTTGLGVSNGTTGYTVGDGSDADRWGDITGTAAGTSSDNTNWTATTIQAFIAAGNVVLTAKVGNFDATGVIYVSVQYLIGQCD